MSEPLGGTLNPRRTFDRSLRVTQEQNRRPKHRHIDNRVPNQNDRRPDRRQKPQEPGSKTSLIRRGRRRFVRSREGGEGVGIGGAASAGEE